MKRKIPDGVKVRFAHGRRVGGEAGTFYRTRGRRDDLESWAEKGLTPAPRGGHTSCELTFPDGESIWGVADCSYQDNYSKRIGRDIALGRALKAAAKKYPDLFKTVKEKV